LSKVADFNLPHTCIWQWHPWWSGLIVFFTDRMPFLLPNQERQSTIFPR